MKWMQYSLTSGLQIHAQTINETCINNSTMKMEKNDRILDCAMYYGRSIGRKCKVILLSTDHNLILKGISHSINSLGSFAHSPQSSIKEIFERSNQIVNIDNQIHQNLDNIVDNFINIPHSNSCGIELADRLKLISNLVENSFLESNLRFILDKNIGPEWIFLISGIPKNGSKWSFKFMFGILSKYWISGFRKSLPSYSKILIDEIIESYKRLEIASKCISENTIPIMLDSNECNILVKKISDFLNLFGIIIDIK